MPSRSNNERPYKFDVTFPHAIQFLATAPKPGSATQTDSQAAESGSTREAGLEAALEEIGISDHQTLLDFLPDSRP